MTHELQKRFRPKSFRSVIGQSQALVVLEKKLQADGIPHALLLSGPSGTGKTTIGRILQQELNAGPNFIEMDAARNNGIDTIRRIEQRARLSPMGGDCTVYLIDECHQLTTAAQQAFLKILEDTPAHVYFFLATTHPEKLIPTIRNRCTHIALKSVGEKDLEKLVLKVCKHEKIKLEEEVLDALCKAAEGSPRRALVLLDALREHEDPDDQLEVIRSSAVEREAVEICRILFRQGGKRNWTEMVKVLKSVQDEPESIRRMVLGYARSCLLNQPRIAARASVVIEAFCDHYYDSGAAGLALSCWQVIHGE